MRNRTANVSGSGARKRAATIAASILLVLLIVAVLEAQFHFLDRFWGSGSLTQRELATRKLGEYLAAHHRGKRAIILSNPFSQARRQPREVYQFERSGLRGLRQGLKEAVTIEAVVFPNLKPGLLENPRAAAIDPGTTTPLSYLIADDAWDQLADRHPQATILVSLIGLPLNVKQSRCWQPASGRSFALLLPDLRMLGDTEAVRQAVRTGKIAAMVLNKPGAPSEDQPLGHDDRMEFDQRFLLVTPETVDQYLRAYPRLF